MCSRYMCNCMREVLTNRLSMIKMEDKKMLKKLRNMNVKPKLLVSFIMIVGIASISGILGLILLTSTDSKYSKALVVNGFTQGDIGSFNACLYKNSAVVRDIIMLKDADELKAAQQNLVDIQEKSQDSLEKLKKNCNTVKEKEYIAIIEEQLPIYRDLRDKIIQLGLQNKNDEAFILLRTQANPILDEIMTATENLVDLNVTMGEEVSENLTNVSKITVIIILVVISIAVVLSIVFATFIANMFSEPIIKIQNASAKLAKGELDIEIVSMSEDEIGQMTNHFSEAVDMLKLYIAELSHILGEIAKGNFNINTTIDFKGDFKELAEAINIIVESLSEAMTHITDTSEQVSLGSTQMAESAQSLAEGAMDQAGAVEELTATIGNVTDLVQTNADNANKALIDANELKLEAEKSERDMQELMLAMERIIQTSKQIENIIAGIEDIASQTNLLSLNASIEAARAGEAGKGFAVVANQIGKLATESAKSAVDTKNLIVNSLQEIQKGNEITHMTTQSINNVIGGIKLLAKSSDEISNMSNEQAESMKQIELGMEQISSVVQSNSAAAQETSATSEELAAQSEGLRQLVGQFVLKN